MFKEIFSESVLSKKLKVFEVIKRCPKSFHDSFYRTCSFYRPILIKGQFE